MFCVERCGRWHPERFQPKPHGQMLGEAALARANTTGTACSWALMGSRGRSSLTASGLNQQQVPLEGKAARAPTHPTRQHTKVQPFHWLQSISFSARPPPPKKKLVGVILTSSIHTLSFQSKASTNGHIWEQGIFGEQTKANKSNNGSDRRRMGNFGSSEARLKGLAGWETMQEQERGKTRQNTICW